MTQKSYIPLPVFKPLADENGSVIVLALLALAVLTIIGLFSSTTSQIETQVATNDILYKKAFYAADGGTEIAGELIEQNLSCPKGFNPSGSYIKSSSYYNALTGQGVLSLDQTESFLQVNDLDFAYQGNKADADDDGDGSWEFPTDAEHDLWFGDSSYSKSDYDRDNSSDIDPVNDNMTLPHTNVVAFGTIHYNTGTSLQMAAGYEGKGKGMANGGGRIVYQVHSRHQFPARNSTAYIKVEYWHIIGMEGTCRF